MISLITTQPESTFTVSVADGWLK